MSELDVDAIEARAAAATEGPWHHIVDGPHNVALNDEGVKYGSMGGGYRLDAENYEGIEAADFHERKAWSAGFEAGQDALVEYIQEPIVSAADGVPALNPQENQ